MTIEHLNPEALHVNPAFSQGTIASAGRTLYVGGQNGTDSEGVITGDAAEQSAQAMNNVMAVLDAAGAKPSDVAKLTIYLAESVDPTAAYGAVMPVWGTQPTAVSVLKVAALGRPGGARRDRGDRVARVSASRYPAEAATRRPGYAATCSCTVTSFQKAT